MATKASITPYKATLVKSDTEFLAVSSVLQAAGLDTGTITAILDSKSDVELVKGASDVTAYNYASQTSDVVVVIPEGNAATNVATGSGNDLIVASNLQGTVSTGEGNDAVFVAQSATTYNLAGGNDSLYIGTATGSLSINGGAGADVVSVTAGDASGSLFNLGDGNDTVQIAAGASDVTIVGGAGNDYISLGAGVTGAVIQIGTNTGHDTVLGFNGGFSDDADVIALSSGLNNVKSVTFEANGVKIKQGSSSVLVDGATGITTTTANVDAKVKVGSTTYKVSLVNTTDTVASDELADIYYAASTSGVTQELNFGSYSDALVVDLTGNTASKYVSDKDAYTGFNTQYYGTFETIVGGTSSTILVGGADTKETLQAGGGDTTLFGGGKANDYMAGAATGSDTFVYYTGQGKDTVSGFTAGTGDDADLLALGWANAQEVYVDSNGDTIVKYKNATDKLTVSGVGADAAVRYSIDNGAVGVAKVGVKGQANSFTYDSEVTAYMGQNSKDTLSISGSDNVELWMDGGSGVFFNSVDNVDASSATGDVGLAGTGISESLVGGSGNTSLWGGNGGNDTLQGGSGATKFYFGKGNGSDVVVTSNTDDMVMAYDISLDDVAGWSSNSSGSLTATLKDGSKLTVTSNTGVSSYQLNDGSQWTYDHNTKEWSQK